MRTKVQKWGNSLALRIPSALARETKLEANGSVDLSLIDGKLVIAPVAEPGITLAALLAGVTEDNLHGEVRSSGPVGAEAW